MKKTFLVIFSLLILVFGFALAVTVTSLSMAQTEATPDGALAIQSNYILGPHVMGSGGLIGATNENYLHSATVGQAIVGIAHGTNNYVQSGFWHPSVYQPPQDVSYEETDDLPATFELYQNYPNPFNPQTTIRYDLPNEFLVTVEIFNVVGQRICILLNEQTQGPGTIQLAWYGVDDGGRAVSSGIYLYRIRAATVDSRDVMFQIMRKMLYVK